MVWMRVIKANDVQAVVAGFALDAHKFLGSDLITIVRGVGTRISRAHSIYHDVGIGFTMAEQNAAAFIRICFFPVLANRVVLRLFQA